MSVRLAAKAFIGASAAFLGGQLLGFSVPVVSSLFGVFGKPALTAVAVLAVAAVVVVRTKPAVGTSLTSINSWYGALNDTNKASTAYDQFHAEGQGGDVDARKTQYTTMVNLYYDLSTDFYENGWGKSFHFGRRYIGEDMDASLHRHEMWLAAKGGFTKGMKIIDLGCGVGGPMRTIARFTGANIIGVNNNAYQIQRGQRYNVEAGLDEQCSFTKADFMHLPFKDNELDGAYAIEATCHAPDKAALFKEILRVLKPGAMFVGFEWCMTDKYDKNNAQHRLIKKEIEHGDGLPDLAMTWEVDQAMREAGFQNVVSEDIAPVNKQNPIPWYAPLAYNGGLSNLRCSPLGVAATHVLVTVMETLRLAPKGTVKTHSMLRTGARGLVAGGQTGTFTPMYFFGGRKPI